MQNKIVNLTADRKKHLDELLSVWENSVRATHLFLTEKDIIALKPIVLKALEDITSLFCIFDSDADKIVAFMGVEGNKLEMLFVYNSYRGTGVGKKLLRYALETLNVEYVDVNEQNRDASGFYKHCGFEATGRSDLDGQGNPFPILHMRRIK